MRQCDGHDNWDDEDDYPYIQCPEGEMYCLGNGMCSRDCGGGSKRYPDHDDDDYDFDGLQCPEGTIYDLSTGGCIDERFLFKREVDDDIIYFDDGSRRRRCDDDRVYCPEIDACVSDSCDLFRMDICDGEHQVSLMLLNRFYLHSLFMSLLPEGL